MGPELENPFPVSQKLNSGAVLTFADDIQFTRTNHEIGVYRTYIDFVGFQLRFCHVRTAWDANWIGISER
jgi:hypothetical protein